MAKFCQLNFQIENRKLYDPAGRELDYPLKVGGSLIHWADPVRAKGWFQHARDVSTDSARIATLDAPINKSDLIANRNQARAQFDFMLEIMTSLAHGYNLLNLVWWNDPEARSMYRTFIAGLPDVENSGSGDSYIRALFSEAYDYNPNWYTKDIIFPHVKKRPDNWGIIQNKCVDMTARAGGKNGDNFVISAAMTVAPTGGLKQGEVIESAEAIYNIPIVRSRYNQQCGPGPVTITNIASSSFDATASGSNAGNSFDRVDANPYAKDLGYPWNQQCMYKSLQSSVFTGSGTDAHGLLPDGSDLVNGFDDWRAAFYFNSGLGTYVTAPLREYLTYLQIWSDRMVSRTAQQIIQDTRAYVVYQNAMTIQRNGASVGEAWAKIAGTAASIESQKHSRSAEASIVSGVLGVAAGVAATVPGAGTAVSLILGAAALVVTIGDTLITKGTHGHGRNDLGQYKLQFERAWLSNDPTATDPQLGAPILPATELVDPPGSWPDTPCAAVAGLGSSSTGGATSGNTGITPGGGSSTPQGIQAIFQEKNLKYIFGGIAAVTLIGILASSRR